MGEVLFQIIILELSVHGWMAPLLWAFGEAEHCGSAPPPLR